MGGGVGVSKPVVGVLPPEREYLVLDNMRLVDFVLHKRLHIQVTDPNYGELQSEGYIGLVKAAISFDESYGTKFSTHAVPFIQGYIQRFRRDHLHNHMKVSRSVIDNYNHIMQLVHDGLSYEQIAEKLDISMLDIKEALESKDAGLSLDNTISDDGEAVFASLVGYTDNAFEEIEDDDEILKHIEHVASRLSDKDQNIWYDYIYPAYFGEHVRETALGLKYNVSQAQVSRILRKAKRMLAKELGLSESCVKSGSWR